MATTTALHPFRQIDHAWDTTDLFVYSGAIPVTAGTVVKIGGSGWLTDDAGIQLGGPAGGATYRNIVSEYYTSKPWVSDAGSGDLVAGMLLKDVRDVDENGEKLRYHPRSADERDYVLSGRPVPILQKGFVLISGVAGGRATQGLRAYPTGAGLITTDAQAQAEAFGKFYGGKNKDGYALLYVNVK